ncbi:hypothetical protein D3C78_1111800 [compost metagenome]
MASVENFSFSLPVPLKVNEVLLNPLLGTMPLLSTLINEARKVVLSLPVLISKLLVQVLPFSIKSFKLLFPAEKGTLLPV